MNSYNEGKALAAKYGMSFFEVSAKTLENLPEAFEGISPK